MQHTAQGYGFQLRGLLFQPHQSQQIPAQRFQPLAFVVDIISGGAAGGEAHLAAAQDIGKAEDARHRGFQLVGKRGHKIIFLAGVLLQGLHGALHRLGHLVKAAA